MSKYFNPWSQKKGREPAEVCNEVIKKDNDESGTKAKDSTSVEERKTVRSKIPLSFHPIRAKSNRAMKSKQYSEAIALLDQLINMYPDNYYILYDRASVYSNMGENNLALKEVDKAIKSDPTKVDAIYFCGEIHLTLGNLEAARKMFTQGLTKDPDNPRAANALRSRAILNKNVGKIKNAASDLDKLILKTDYSDRDAILQRGRIYLDMKEYGEGLGFLRKVVRNEDVCELLILCGTFSQKLKYFELASYYFNTACNQNPNNSLAFAKYAKINFVTKDFSSSLKNFEIALSLGHKIDASFLRKRGQVYYELKQYNKALLDINEALKLHEKSTTYVIRAKIFKMFKCIEKALSDLDKSLELDPGNEKARSLKMQYTEFANRHNNQLDILNSQIAKTLDAKFLVKRAHLYRLMKRYDEALKDLNDATTILPDDVDAHIEYGEIYRNQSNYDNALYHLSKALLKDPQSDYIQRLLGRIYYLKNDPFAAKYRLKLSLTRNKFSSAYRYLGKSEMLLGHVEEAIENFNKALQLQPVDPDVLLDRAEAFAQLKKYEESLEDLDQAIELSYENERIYELKGLINARLGKYQEALEYLNTFTEIHSKDNLSPNINALLVRAKILFKFSLYFNSLSDYNKILEIEPTHVEALFNRGKIHLEIGEYEKSLSDFSNLLDPQVKPYGLRNVLSTEEQDVLRKLLCLRAESYYHLNRYEDALDSLGRVSHEYKNALVVLNKIRYPNFGSDDLERDDEYRNLKRRVFSLRGMTHSDLGEYEKALADFDAALEDGDCGSRSWVIYCERSRTLLREGNKEKAWEDLKKVLTADL
ncbi:2210_t:CDS:2 [Acaulospora colombiana]|uniref:2210_t:CDS:1 n=1 Tax=Acaulospora colombiana TaxID=27376 RepID=A0ACA9KWM8_9GLOM|nr:2210_t:CDS:2 [Acaulospora colombiana]